jgi:hypothetical protein
VYTNGKFANSFAGIDLKLNRKKNAKVKENAQITKSIIKIDQRGKLYFQKYSSILCISVKIRF